MDAPLTWAGWVRLNAREWRRSGHVALSEEACLRELYLSGADVDREVAAVPEGQEPHPGHTRPAPSGAP